MKAKGFTLLETLIALAISVIVMGAAVTANRVVQQGAQVSEQRAQIDALLAESFDLVSMTHNHQRLISQSFSGAFDGVATTLNSPVRVVPYRFSSVTPITSTTPLEVRWCTTASLSPCSSLISPASPTAASFPMANALSGAEIIAVRRGTPVVGEPQVYDFLYLPTLGSVVSSSVSADNATHQREWDFFRRQIDITNRTTPYTGFTVTVSVWPVLAGVNRPADVATRTMVFTDF